MINPRARPCDEQVIRSSRGTVDCTTRERRWVLAAAILASVIAYIDESVVNVALPAISDRDGSDPQPAGLHAGLGGAQARRDRAADQAPEGLARAQAHALARARAGPARLRGHRQDRCTRGDPPQVPHLPADALLAAMQSPIRKQREDEPAARTRDDESAQAARS